QFQAGKLDEADYSRLADLIEGTLDRVAGRYKESDAIICPINGPGVALVYEKYSLGIYSDLDIANILNDAGYRTSGGFGNNPFGKDTTIHLLQNRFYIGETSYQGKKGQPKEYIPGKHEPLISQELFEMCQEVRAKRATMWSRGAPNQIATYPLSSLLVCIDCGNIWRGWKLRSDRRYRDPARDKGQTCPSFLHSVVAEKFEDAAADILMNLNLPSNWKDRALAMIAQDQPQVAAIKNQQTSLQGQLGRLKHLFVLGDITEAEYRQANDRLQGQFNALPLPTQGRMIDLERAENLLGDIRNIWQGATLQEREIWFKLMYTKIYVREGEIKAIEPTSVLWVLLSETIDT
ncbi:MAG: recombinase family protein, partial [Taibaiella sp.]|nr:recombinase family protein [Taibaiella sp.]